MYKRYHKWCVGSNIKANVIVFFFSFLYFNRWSTTMNGSSSPPFLTTQRKVDASPFLFLLFLAVIDFAWLASSSSSFSPLFTPPLSCSYIFT